MNIAFPAVFFFLLLLPGVIFQKLLHSREVQAAELTPFSSNVIFAITTATIFNIIVVTVAVFLDYNFHLGEILRLLSSSISPAPIYQRLNIHPFDPIGFFLATNGLAASAAILWRWLVSTFRLDHPSCRFYTYLRPPAPWHYLFSGIDALDEKPDSVVIAAIVPFKDCSYLYTGLLEDYELNEKGELDRLILSDTMRRPLLNDREEGQTTANTADRFYPIDGDRFVLRASEYITLNIKFLVIKDADSDTAEESSNLEKAPENTV